MGAQERTETKRGLSRHGLRPFVGNGFGVTRDPGTETDGPTTEYGERRERQGGVKVSTGGVEGTDPPGTGREARLTGRGV